MKEHIPSKVIASPAPLERASASQTVDNIIEVNHLTKAFRADAGFFARADKTLLAVDDLSFAIERGTTYGIVGESGSGKTTTARLIVRMYEATSGSILWKENAHSPAVDIGTMGKKELRAYRERVKYIFQDPARSLNPRMTIYQILTAALRRSSLWQGEDAARVSAARVMEEVRLDASDLYRRPAEFSGGQRQRIAIGRALIMKPSLLICDEVVSALDVSVQGEVINLLNDIRLERGMSIVFITHDLKVACYFCDRIGVMYKGRLVEEASASTLYKAAEHPYTKTLFGMAEESTHGSI